MNVQSTTEYFKSLSSAPNGQAGTKKSEKNGTEDQKGGKGNGMDGLCEKGSQVCLGPQGVQKVYTGLASLVNSPQDAEDLIRKELLLARSRSPQWQERDDTKRFYFVGGATLVQTETTHPVARIIGGTNLDQRTTNTVGLKRLKIKFTIQRQPSAPSTAAARTPIFTYVVWRDKVPATPGTAPTVIGTDSIPPTSTSLVFSRLGVAVGVYNSLFVRNPVTDLEYHIYKVGHIELNDKATYDYTTPATAFGIPAPQRWLEHIDVDLHNVEQIYGTYGATAPDVNDIYFTYWVDLESTNQGFNDVLNMSSEVEFEDLEDDGDV